MVKVLRGSSWFPLFLNGMSVSLCLGLPSCDGVYFPVRPCRVHIFVRIWPFAGVLNDDLADLEHLRELVLHGNTIDGSDKCSLPAYSSFG